MPRLSRRPLYALLGLLLVVALARQAGVLPDAGGMRRAMRRLLEPPSRAEMDRAARQDSLRQARAAKAPEFTPLDPPVTVRQMLLWFAIPVAGTALLVFATGRRRR